MEFKHGYRLLYQKAKEIYASKKNIPTIEDEVVDTGLTEEEKKNIKLVYEKKEGIIVNFTGLPTVDDKPIELTAGGEVVVGPSGDDPTGSLIKFKGGDRFVKFHFNTTLTPNYSDFDSWVDVEGFGKMAILCGFDWYVGTPQEYEEYDKMLVAYFFAKGTKIDSTYTVKSDSFGIMYSSKDILPIYADEGMAQVLTDLFGGELAVTPGWLGNADSLIGVATFLQDDVILQGIAGQLWNQGTEGVDYNKDWNGKFIGFKEEDYYEPGPTPTTYTVSTNSVDNTTISGAGTYEEDTDVVVSIQANEGCQFIGTPTATENGETLELTNVEGVYSATITVHNFFLNIFS